MDKKENSSSKYLVFHGRKKVIQVWNVNDDWIFYPFKALRLKIALRSKLVDGTWRLQNSHAS